MDQLNHDAFGQPIQPPNPSAPEFRLPYHPHLHSLSNGMHPDSSQRSEPELKNCAARNTQKADREKLRRDRLNEQFMELGNVLDPDRPKNDKASILADTVQVLKDLTAQVNRLKADFATLTEESRELNQEKNELREEKASLKSDIENLNVQYQHRVRAIYPWAGIDHSAVMHPPSYPFPVPVPVPPGSIPLHPSFQPYQLYGNQNSGVTPIPCSNSVPFLTPTTLIEQQSAQFVSPMLVPGNRSHISSRQDTRHKSVDHQGESRTGRSEDSNEVATELELKTPGTTTDQDSSSGQRKSKKSPRKETSISDGNSSSRCSSSRSVQDSSSNNVVGGRKASD